VLPEVLLDQEAQPEKVSVDEPASAHDVDQLPPVQPAAVQVAPLKLPPARGVPAPGDAAGCQRGRPAHRPQTPRAPEHPDHPALRGTV
jgi:hypothetical protein